MKKLYNSIREALQEVGFNIAPFSENTIDNGERTAILDITELSPVQAGFDTWEATFTLEFVNGNSWEENSLTLWQVLCSFIPLEDRLDPDTLQLPDKSNVLTLLDTPQFSDINSSHDEDTGYSIHSVTVTINFNYA